MSNTTNKAHKLIISLILVVIGVEASAQRTSFGEMMASVNIGTSFSGVGADISIGSYQLPGFWFLSLNYYNRTEKDSYSGDFVDYPRAKLAGGYMFRIASSYGRTFNLYGGMDGFVGMELCNLYKRMSEPTRKAYEMNGFSNVRFIYGFTPRLEIEYFVLPSIAIDALLKTPFGFNTKFHIAGVELSLGAKINW